MVHKLHLHKAVTKNMRWDYKVMWPSSASHPRPETTSKQSQEEYQQPSAQRCGCCQASWEQSMQLSSSHLNTLDDGKSLSFKSGLDFWDHPSLFRDKYDASGWSDWKSSFLRLTKKKSGFLTQFIDCPEGNSKEKLPKCFEQRQQHWKTTLKGGCPSGWARCLSPWSFVSTLAKGNNHDTHVRGLLWGVTKIMHKVPGLRAKGGRKFGRKEEWEGERNEGKMGPFIHSIYIYPVSPTYSSNIKQEKKGKQMVQVPSPYGQENW